MIMTLRPKRRKSLRLSGYNYARAGAYFVTICANARKNLFGTIVKDEMHLNETGCMIDTCWQELASYYPEVKLDYFTVMPNHIHGIIFIVGAGSPRPEMPLTPLDGETPPLPRYPNLSKIIGYFKYQSTKQVNKAYQTPGTKLWQRGFYDHVIRDEDSLNRIRAYIETNPLRCHLDRENPVASARDDFDLWLHSLNISRPETNPFSKATLEKI